MKKIKWGLVGFGDAAKSFCNNINKNYHGSVITGIASKSKFSYLKKNTNYQLYSNYDDIFENNNIDIIYISLINSLHFKYLKKAIENNKNVLVEKPSCLSFDEINQINEINKIRNIYFKEAILYLHHPILEEVVKIIKNENLGKIIEIISEFGFNFKKKKFLYFLKNKNKKMFDKNLGGGSIMNYGHYPISIFKFFNKEFKKIKNFKVSTNYGSYGVDEASNIEIEFCDQTKLISRVSIIENLKSYIQIIFENGEIFIPNPWLPSKEYEIVLKKFNTIKNLKFYCYKSLWELTTKSIYSDLISNQKKPSVFGTDINSSLEYMSIIDKWKKIGKR